MTHSNPLVLDKALLMRITGLNNVWKPKAVFEAATDCSSLTAPTNSGGEVKRRAFQVEVMIRAKEQRGHTWVWRVNSE